MIDPITENYLNRFSGIARLYGRVGMERLAQAHVAIIGLGGVGSWVVESVARSGVGEITLMDFDDVCVSNFNRQIHGVDSNIGQFKVDVMEQRVLSINKECRVHKINDRFVAENAEVLLKTDYDYIIDAFDNGPGKSFLAAHCRRNQKKLMVLGSVGGKKDPSLIKMDDLSRSREDSLLSFMRKKLRADYKFPRDKKFGIPCVYSSEKYVYYDGECAVPEKPKEVIKQLDCGGGMGAVTHLSASFAFFAVSRVVSDIVNGK